MDGEPPDLPAVGFSNTARDFVRRCLNKVPKLRPTYAMLLRHAWLSPLMKPPSISEEDEDTEAFSSPSDQETPITADEEVSEWVLVRWRGGGPEQQAGARNRRYTLLRSTQYLALPLNRQHI